MAITKRQREVLDHLSENKAFTLEKAHSVYGTDGQIADKLAASGAINKRYDAKHGEIYWIRAENEPATTANIPAGFVVALQRDVTTPSGRVENFFLARALYDGKGVTFRKLLRSWMTRLDLKSKDLLHGIAIDIIEPDSAVFAGDHRILDDLSLESS